MSRILAVSVVVIFAGLIGGYFLDQPNDVENYSSSEDVDSNQEMENAPIKVPVGWINTLTNNEGTNSFVSYVSPDSNPSNPNAEIKIVSVLSSESLPPEDILTQHKQVLGKSAKNFIDRKFEISGVSIYEEQYEFTRNSVTSYHRVLLFTSKGRNFNISAMYKAGEGDKYAQDIETALNSISFE